jgi:tubulin epsilon
MCVAAELLQSVRSASGRRGADDIVTKVFEPSSQLLRVDPLHDRYLACALLARGADFTAADLQANIGRMKSKIDMVQWNQAGFKVGVCATPAPGQPRSLLQLANNCSITDCLYSVRDRFVQLYTVRAHLHHYLEYIEQSMLDEALNSLDNLCVQYEEMRHWEPSTDVQAGLMPLFV